MTSSKVVIRELRSTDRAAWDVLWNAYCAFYEHDLEQYITETVWRRLIDPADQPYGLVAVDGAEIVGFVHFHFHLSTWSVNGYCYLEDLFVSPAARGKGAGRALIQAVYRAADARAATRVNRHT